MDMITFDCTVGDTLHIGNKVTLVILDTAALPDIAAVTLQIDATSFILVEDKLVENKNEVCT